MNKIISGSEARRLGLKRYFTGKPCKKGHVAERYADKGMCVECEKERATLRSKSPQVKAYHAAYYAKNSDQAKAYAAEYRKANAEKIKSHYDANKERRQAVKAKWREVNAESIRAKKADWRSVNSDAIRAKKALWQKLNPHKAVASVSRRRALKMAATPPWADQSAIDQYYLIAGFLSGELGVEFHVDHIVPLRSETVQGFHSQHNLNIALGAWNISKSNRWWPHMPERIDAEPLAA